MLQVKCILFFSSSLLIVVAGNNETCTADRAMKLWMAKSFMEYYLTPAIENDLRIASGSATFEILRTMNYQEEKKTGAKFDVEKQTLLNDIDDWRNRRFISDGEAQMQKIAIEGMQSNHIVKETAMDRGNLEMIYGLSGFLRLNGKYASVWTFRSFKLRDSSKTPGIKINGGLKDLQRIVGVDWNALLQGGLSEINATQLTNMMAFLRDDALRDFHSENEEFVNNLLIEEKKCSEMLPSEAKNVNSQRALLGSIPIRKAFSGGYPFTRTPRCCK
uniref:Uncharacterized protein n=1 Tax=Romanomermis culicivorax TaxID=13658 RepID=A0A915IL40_ROMCU